MIGSIKLAIIQSYYISGIIKFTKTARESGFFSTVYEKSVKLIEKSVKIR
jgi:hypothetical protein